ncbi:MAG TPA: transaminase [Candidatus Limnocylindrales bacterium]
MTAPDRTPTTTSTVDRARLADLMAREAADFVARHPRSAALHERAKGSLLAGVPMNWMVKWAGAFPLFVDEASGASFTDVDGHEYIDFCLGDTGAMAGHGAGPTVRAVEAQLRRGITHMLPTEDAIAAGDELRRRFGLRWWQFTITATDANRFSIRLARETTKRPFIAVHDHCYHGSVDETFATLDARGRVVASRGNVGPPVDPAMTTRVVEFNDVDGLERALADRQVAALLIEPALTNVGIVLPEAGYLDAVREITRRTGTLLIIDETHTICAGPGGATRAWGLDPDILVIGKTIGGGIPVGTYGLSDEVGRLVEAAIPIEDADVGGIGGTLAGYALSMAAVRATLGEVLTDAAFERMLPLGERWAKGAQDVIDRRNVPWHVTRLGARAEYHFMAKPPRTGAEQAANADFELERFLHLWAMNRGILMTPFHNMALMSPATTEADVDRHTEVFAAAVDALFA